MKAFVPVDLNRRELRRQPLKLAVAASIQPDIVPSLDFVIVDAYV